MNIPNVEIYTDGACSGNPGVGGWASVLLYEQHKKELYGNAKETTNNRMELTAVIEALKALKRPCNVTLYSDSKYVIDSINKDWVYKWKANNWIKSDRKPALNTDLWKELLTLLEVHRVKFVWVKGHNGNEYNERCDELAVNAIKEIR